MINFLLRVCIFLFTALPLFLCINSASAAQWGNLNHPGRMSKDLNYFFDQLPLKGSISNKKIGWPGNHWANIESGIAYRWTAVHSENFRYKSPSMSELKYMSEDKISSLSPAEKFSILNRDYNYNTVRRVWGQTSPREASWNGICHGVAPASIDYEEPETVQVTNSDGIALKFYSSDVKALLSYFYAKVARPNVRMIGTRCNAGQGSRGASRFSCIDVNPGALHIIMANYIGLYKKPFIADIDRYHEVWNHVAIDYESYIVDEYAPSPNSARGSVKRIRVQSSVNYSSAISRHENPVIGTEDAYYFDQPYDYYLDIDSIGRIIGGEWIGDIRPDFIWEQTKPKLFGKWKSLEKIYQPITL